MAWPSEAKYRAPSGRVLGMCLDLGSYPSNKHVFELLIELALSQRVQGVFWIDSVYSACVIMPFKPPGRLQEGRRFALIQVGQGCQTPVGSTELAILNWLPAVESETPP